MDFASFLKNTSPLNPRQTLFLALLQLLLFLATEVFCSFYVTATVVTGD